MLRSIEYVIERRMMARCYRFLLNVNDRHEDDSDWDVLRYYYSVMSCRYYSPRKFAMYATTRLRYLVRLLPAPRFQKLFRVTRPFFHKVVALIRDSPCFASTPGRHPVAPVELHVLVILAYLGTSGNGNSNDHLGLLFHIGSGSVVQYRKRAIHALLQLKSTSISWPSPPQRCAIASRIGALDASESFTNCVGFIDGTLFPLETRPELNGEDYYSRKGCYALSSQIVCNDYGAITYINIGTHV